MLGKVLFVTLLGLCFANFFENDFKKLAPIRNGVQRFAMNIPDDTKDQVRTKLGSKAVDLIGKIRSSLLLHGAPLGSFRPQQMLPLFGLPLTSSQKTKGSGRPLTLKSFKFDNCSASAGEKASFVIKKMIITPDPVVLPGELTFQFDIDILKTINNLEAAVKIDIFIGGKFVEVPCIGLIGSCIYPVCDLLAGVDTCPQELVDRKIPCKCPFKKNSYKEPGLSATIDAAVFMPGDYNATATLTSNGGFVGCYTATFTLED